MKLNILKRLLGRRDERDTKLRAAPRLETSSGGRVIRKTSGWHLVENSQTNPYDTATYLPQNLID